METLLLVVGYQIAWAAGLCFYLSSQQQTLLSRAMPKKPGITVLSGGIVAATVALTFVYHWLAALLTVIMIITLIWIALALASPYISRLKAVVVSGTAITLLISLTGGHHVG